MDLAAPGPPSRTVWRLIAQALDAESDPGRLDAALDVVAVACIDWPDELRLAPGRWMQPVFEGNAEPRLRVTRAMDVILPDADVPGDRLAWSDAPALSHHSVVRVLDSRLGDGGLARWSSGSSHRDVRELALGSGITDGGISRLGEDDRLRGLTSLALFRNRVGADGIGALMGSPNLGSGLQRLLLGRNPLGVAGMASLATVGDRLRDLAVLDLDSCALDADAVDMLCEAPLLATVRWLNLSNNALGRRGCEALAACSRLRSLQELFLHGCELGDDDVLPLLEAPWLARLSNVALSANRLSMHTVARIARRPDWALDELDICHNHFAEADAVAALMGSPRLRGLRRLCA